MQANKLFKCISLFNFIFYSLSLSVPSILLIFFNDLLLNELICISILIKVFCIILVITYSIFKKLIDKNKRNKILLKYLKKNSQWLTLNSFLVQLYEFLDKYLIKIFLGSSLLAIYSIPQQITGKLSILSKGFSTFLLPNLGNKKSEEFIHSVDFFLRYIPILIFLVVPFYPFIFSIWLGDQYTSTIHDLAKIFSLVAIYLVHPIYW